MLPVPLSSLNPDSSANPRSGPYDIVIVGGGPAGLTAGLYAVRAGRSVLLLEQLAPGGQAVTTWQVDNYPGFSHVSGAELMQKMESQARELGVSILTSTVTDVQPGPPHRLISSAGEFSARTVIVAAGAAPRTLGIPGEDHYRGRGVSYCGTCDAAFFRGMPVAVIGGGNTALEESEFIARFASKVYLIHRRESFRADRMIQERIWKNPKIERLVPYVPQEILGDAQGVKHLKLGLRNSPECMELDVNGVFVFVGLTPQTGGFRGIADLDEDGYIQTTPGLETRTPGIFACGDCRLNLAKQIVVAAAEGAVAAIQADRYLARHAE